MIKKQTTMPWWLPFFGLLLCAYWIQSNMFFNHDAAIIYHTAALMLQGQTYAQGIIEPNPPMIFYLNFLPIIISNFFNLKMLAVFQLYVFSLTFISVICSRYLFKKIFQCRGTSGRGEPLPDATLVNFMSYGLCFVLLFLPAGAFGQREQFLLILTIPYILLAAYRLENIERGIADIPKLLIVLIGVMAGIGFSIKPYFLTTLMFTELYFIYRKRSVFGWLRIESAISVLILLIYGASVLIFYPAYLNIIVPMWMPLYLSRMSSWQMILTNPSLLFCVAAIAVSCLTPKEEQYASLKGLLTLAIAGYIITFLIPRADWYYHLYPAMGMSCLYFFLILGELSGHIPNSNSRLKNSLLTGVLALTILFMPLYLCINYSKELITEFRSNGPLRQLTNFMNQQGPNNNYNYFSINHRLNILEFYSTARYTGSFPFFWEFNRLRPGKFPEALQKKNRSYLLKIVAQDLNDKQPRFVIIDTTASKHYINQYIDYPREYSKHKSFREAWSHYGYMTSIKPYDIYQRRV